MNEYLRSAKSAAVCLVFALAASAYAQSANEILQKMRDTYGAMKSYADTGVILDENGVTDKYTFSTYFNRSPRHFLLDFHKQTGDRFVVWGDPDAFHTWWKTTSQKFDYPNPSNAGAISGSGQNTKGAALKIPTLLYPKTQLGGDFSNYTDVAMDGTENIGGERCYRLVGNVSDSYSATGNQVNRRKLTVWVDAQLFLVRQISEDFGPMPGSNKHSVRTVTYQPIANPTLDDNKFRFTPPER